MSCIRRYQEVDRVVKGEKYSYSAMLLHLTNANTS